MNFLPVVVKELRQLRRDRRTLSTVFLLPILVMVLFGYGYGGPSGKIAIAIANLDRGPLGRIYVDAAKASEYIVVKYYAESESEALNLVVKGLVYAAIIIPETFTEHFVSGKTAYVIVITDESIPAIAQSVKVFSSQIGYNFQLKAAERVGVGKAETIYKTVYGPQVSSMDTFLALVVAMVLFLVPATLMGVSISRERERGTFEQLIVSPLTKWDLLIGKFIAYFIATLSEVFLVILLAIYWFGATLRGSLVDAIVFSILYLIGNMGLGLLISVLSENQLQAQQAVILAFGPQLLFSGTFIPVEVLGDVAGMIAKINPMAYFVWGFRNIFIKGASILEVQKNVISLLIYTLTMLALSISLFRRSLE